MCVARPKPYRLLIALFIIPALAAGQNPPSGEPGPTSPPNTLFVQCGLNLAAQDIFSPLSISQDGGWRAYIEVQTSERNCAHTSKLFVSEAAKPFRLVYLIAPERYVLGNGMAILGWAERSNTLLVRIEKWQEGSDASDEEELMAVDATDGVVHSPDLDGLLNSRTDKQCSFRILDAGFSADKFPAIIVRARFFTFHDGGDDTQARADEKCAPATESWKVFDDGQARRVADSTALHLYRKFVPNPQSKR